MNFSCVPVFTASWFCPFLLFTKRRKPQCGKEGKGRRNLKVFCAPADARRRRLCIVRFHAGVKTDSRRRVSFPPHKRYAGLCGGFGEVWHGSVTGVRRSRPGRLRSFGMQHLSPPLGNQRGPRTALFVVLVRGSRGKKPKSSPLMAFWFFFDHTKRNARPKMRNSFRNLLPREKRKVGGVSLV